MNWNLFKLRKENDDTQEEIAKLLGINVVTYRAKEHGESQFKADEMFLLGEYYNKELSEIFLPTEYTKSKQTA